MLQDSDGGIAVTFLVTMQTLYGSHGGTEGKPVGLATLYHIDVCQQSPVTIDLCCGTTVHVEPVDGTVTLNYAFIDTYSCQILPKAYTFAGLVFHTFYSHSSINIDLDMCVCHCVTLAMCSVIKSKNYQDL